jgi:hypothetical protein
MSWGSTRWIQCSTVFGILECGSDREDPELLENDKR